MTSTVITIIAGLLILWLVYEIIKGSYNAKKEKIYPVLKYGDKIEWWENNLKPVKAIVLGQIKDKVRIRTEDDCKVWLVRRDECELRPYKEESIEEDGEPIQLNNYAESSN